ncbi:MAG: FtsX-like permease family protein [Bacteroidota bacterium]|nr:FtsX-like permease family protein [Bacteroidota bacterium]
MNFPLFIASRYLISKKSRNIINLISGVSIAGITVGTMALIIVLSIFNGLDDLIKSLFSSFDPEIKITLAEGKTFSIENELFNQIRSDPSTAVFTEVVEENAMIDYRNRQAIVTIKGVSDNFSKLTGIDSLIVDGSFQLWENERPVGVIGYELAAQLSVGLSFFDPMYIFVPRQISGIMLNQANAFNKAHIFPRGIFSVQQEYDAKYLLIPIDFARNLLNYKNVLTSVELKVSDKENVQDVRDRYASLLGPKYKVQTQYEQHQAFYQVMAAEKWIIFLILGFILIIASFNTASTLTLLVLQKKSDMHLLQSMGALPKTIRQIFQTEGLLITAIGIVLGLMLGTLFCWAQMKFGIVRFPAGGSFIVDIYPLKMLIADFLMVTAMVSVIGFMASVIPVRILGKRYFSSFDGTELNN